MEQKKEFSIEEENRYGQKKRTTPIPLILIFAFIAVMSIYTSRLMQNAAVSNSNALIEDRILNVSSMIDNHLNTAQTVLHVTADAVYHMLVSGSIPARIHEFLVDETNNVEEQFNENFTGLYGYIMSRYMDGLNWEPPEDYDPMSRDWYILAKEKNGEIAFVPPYVDAQTGNVIISVVRLLPDRQNVVSLDVQLKGVQEMVNELTLNGKGYGFVVDDDGFFIAHSNESQRGTNISDTEEGAQFLKKIKSIESGSFTYRIHGEECTVYVNGVKNNWHVAMLVRNSELYHETITQIVINLLIYAIVFILIVIFYYVAYRNERRNAKNVEKMKLEEQKASYERKVLELEKDAANASNKAKSDFLANMSHEIRTPMNAILGMDEMILRTSPKEPIRKYALNIQSAGKTLLSIINGILDFSKIESGKMDLIPVEYSFSSVMNDIVNMTAKKAEDKGLEYILKVSDDIPSGLYGDEIRVRQVMLNLVNNAIKYTHEGSVAITVSFDRETEMLEVSVSDTGIGIREEDIKTLFGSFQRLEEDKNRNIEGTGLGLNIAMQLVRMMDGTIDVHSKYGEGTTFTARMKQKIIDPTPVGDFAQNITRIQADTDEFRSTLLAPNARILIVDDNEMNLEVIGSLLEATRIRLTVASSGKECIEELKKNAFDLVLLDQMMPGMSGTQTLNRIREEKLAEDTPIIALTADAIVGARDNYLKEGFKDYLSKPVMYEELEEILKKYLKPELILTQEQLDAEAKKKEQEDGEKDRPLVLVISESSEMLNQAKERISSEYKGVYLKTTAQAKKYLEKHGAP